MGAMKDVEAAWSRLVTTRVFHAFSHAADSVELLGPFWAWAMWMFENEFGYEIRKLRGRRNITREIEHNAKIKILTVANTLRKADAITAPTKFSPTVVVIPSKLKPYKFTEDDENRAHEWLCRYDATYGELSNVCGNKSAQDFAEWQPSEEVLQTITEKLGCSLDEVQKRVGGVYSVLTEVHYTTRCEVAGRILKATSKSTMGPLSKESCRSAFREMQEHPNDEEPYQQTGVPLLFWKVTLFEEEMVLAKVRYFNHNEIAIPNTDLIGIKLDGDSASGAGVYVAEVRAWNNASYTLCDLCSLAKLPELSELTPNYDKVLIGFSNE